MPIADTPPAGHGTAGAMKLSWIFVLLLLIFVAIFSVQNADVITVRFLAWQFTLSAALLIQLAALLGAFVGIGIGWRSRRASPRPPGKSPVPGPTPPGGHGDHA